MEAPKKIYLSDFTDTTEAVFYVKQDNTKKTDVEYTRTDAFIEKACKFLKDRGNEYIAIVDGQLVLRKAIVKHFKNYMKGE